MVSESANNKNTDRRIDEIIDTLALQRIIDLDRHWKIVERKINEIHVSPKDIVTGSACKNFKQGK
jgi:hypothetical protein